MSAQGKDGCPVDMTNQEFDKLVRSKSTPSPLGKDLLLAFAVGGGICCAGQALQMLYEGFGLSRDDAGTWVTVTLVFLSAL